MLFNLVQIHLSEMIKSVNSQWYVVFNIIYIINVYSVCMSLIPEKVGHGLEKLILVNLT